jgi:serine/threonine protein phosphatase 1
MQTAGLMNIFKFFGFGQSAGTQPHVPDGMRIYAVGDIHGRFDLLQKIGDLIRADLARHPVERSIEIYLGDYVDRGPASKSVLDHLSSDSMVCDKRICLKGNHDDMFLSFLEDPSILTDWRDLGGLETIFSYGVSPPMTRNRELVAECQQLFAAAVPKSHAQFLNGLPLKAEIGSYLFVHAGLRPGRPKEHQDDTDLLWIREPFLSSRRDHGCIVVHGHTPRQDYEILPNRINVDTGAYLSGHLTCAVLEGAVIRVLQT